MSSINSCCILWALCMIGFITCQNRHSYNPSIIQDSRLEPTVDGTFGFLYRTEDGISHTAQGDPNGYVQGSYSYKDPTGLKVNFNYFAGAKKNSNSASASATQPQSQYGVQKSQYRNPEPQYSQQDVQEGYDVRQPEPYYPEREYKPRTRPPTAYTRSREYYESRYNSRGSARLNEVYDVDDYQYRG